MCDDAGRTDAGHLCAHDASLADAGRRGAAAARALIRATITPQERLRRDAAAGAAPSQG
jgi:hypothetical protein